MQNKEELAQILKALNIADPTIFEAVSVALDTAYTLGEASGIRMSVKKMNDISAQLVEGRNDANR